MAFKEADTPLEVVILIIGGMAMLITGTLLFPVHYGSLPYSENGLFGLLLLIFSLQMILLGKTPFGDLPKTKSLLVVGIVIAVVGILTCCIPISTQLPQILLALCFGPGGLFLFLKMCFAKNMLRSWTTKGGIFRHLLVGCGLTYGFSMLIGLILWKRNLFGTPGIAISVVLFGIAILYLAGVLWKLYGQYPEADMHPVGSVELSTDQTMLLLMGVFMVILGLLLIPVSVGFLPFSESAQLGLLMVIFAIQMLAFGGTPIGTFPRSFPLIVCGLLFAALGIVSCIIPKMFVPLLTVLVGVLNIAGGVVSLGKIGVQRFLQQETPPTSTPPILVRLLVTQLVLNLLAILFGSSMLIPGLVHGLVIGVVLSANGFVLLYLLGILVTLDQMKVGQ